MVPSQSRILVTGASGQVGGALVRLLEPLGPVIAPRRSELDLCDPSAIREMVRRTRPDWIINPAAYTAVDRAEGERELAYAINGDAPRVIGETAAELGIPVIHFSTDYVFNGGGNTPWVEGDAPDPLGVYGASKLAGERGLASSGAAHLVFRTSWVYSAGGKNFLLTILRLAQEKPELRIVDDQHGSPTCSCDLARMVVHVIRRIHEQSAQAGNSVNDSVRAVQGTYHAAASGETTWFGFAAAFLRLFAQARPNAKLATLVPITTDAYPTPARRPLNSRLNCGRLRDVFGLSMPDWQKSLDDVMADVLKAESVSVVGR